MLTKEEFEEKFKIGDLERERLEKLRDQEIHYNKIVQLAKLEKLIDDSIKAGEIEIPVLIREVNYVTVPEIYQLLADYSQKGIILYFDTNIFFGSLWDSKIEVIPPNYPWFLKFYYKTLNWFGRLGITS